MIEPSAAELQAHARELAIAFDVRLIETGQLQPEEAMGIARLRVALCSTVVDETTYAVALHEIGHLASPTGIVRHACDGNIGNLMRIEEEAAWTWARHYALLWTPLMESLARWAESTYAAPTHEPPPIAPSSSPQRPIWDNPPAPVAPKRIDWKEWK